MAWTVEAPVAMRATYTFGGTAGQPVLDDPAPADVEFAYSHLTYLLRILTGEHSIMKALERGTVTITAQGPALEALLEASAARG